MMDPNIRFITAAIDAGTIGVPSGMATIGEPRQGTRKVLTPDEIIDAGLDLTVTPSATARAALGSVIRAQRAPGKQYEQAAIRYAHKIDEWPAFAREVFARLYDDDGCKPLAAEKLSTWGTNAMSVLEAQPSWPALRSAASLSRSIAAESAARLADAVANALNLDKLQTDEESMRDPREVQQEMESMVRLMEQAGASTEQVEAVVNEAAAAAAKAVGVRKMLDHQVETARHKIGGVVASVQKKATEKAEAIEALTALGFSREGPGSIEEVAPGLIEQCDPRMLAILKQAGRFREAAQGEMAKANGHCDVVGIQPTGDLAKVTPKTLTDLAGGGIRALVTMGDLLEHSAQGWEQEGKEPRNRGDVAILVDRSGSMSGERERRARGLAIAAMMTIIGEGRRVVACSFAGTNAATLRAALPGDAYSITEAIKVFCIAASGGTDVDYALEKTADMLSTLAGGMREPDVLVVTDGDFPAVNPKVLSKLGDRRLFGVLIDWGDAEAHPEFTATWEVGAQIGSADAIVAINSLRSSRKKVKP